MQPVKHPHLMQHKMNEEAWLGCRGYINSKKQYMQPVKHLKPMQHKQETLRNPDMQGGRIKMRKFVALALLLIFISLITAGCGETLNGMGKDLRRMGTGVKTEVRELLKQMMELAGMNKEVVVEAGTPGDQKGIYADITLTKTELGFKCKYSVKEGLLEMINWAKGFEK